MQDNKCKIKRTGILIRFEPETAVLVIDGREIHVPSAKVSPAVKEGDEVMWTGGEWCVSSPSG
jgi:hypothetical protein